MQHSLYVFALAENVFSNTLPLASTDFVPKLIVHDAIHGIAKIELINFRESAVLIPCWSFQIQLSGKASQIRFLSHINGTHSIETDDAHCKQFECACIKLEMDGVLIDHEIRLINLSITNRNAAFYIRFALFLSTYCVDIRVRCHSKLVASGDGSWSEWSKTHTIHVPSSWISKRFAVKERVLFTPTHSNHSIPGTIIKQVSPLNDTYRIQTGWILHKKCWDVPVSRIYRNGPQLKHMVIGIDKQLLFGCDDMFIVLADIYEHYATTYCKGFPSIADTDYAFIGTYIAKHVIDFVFTTRQHKVPNGVVKCIMNEKDGKMRLNAVWHSLIVNYQQLLVFHQHNDLFIINPTQMQAKVSCNLCGIEISVYEWMYECNGARNVLNKHFVCMMCGDNMIHQHTQMVDIVTSCLNQYFYTDCIQLIVSFVCGSVLNHC